MSIGPPALFGCEADESNEYGRALKRIWAAYRTQNDSEFSVALYQLIRANSKAWQKTFEEGKPLYYNI